MSSELSPPGYASPASDVQAEGFQLPFSVAAFAAGLGSTWLLALHTLCIALPRAYTFEGQSSSLVSWLVVAALIAGALAGRPLKRPAAQLPSALAALSLLASLSGYAFFFAFARGAALATALVALPLLSAFVLGLASSLAQRALGRAFASLALLEYFINPLRAALLGISWLLLLYALPVLGLLRQGAILGALLAGLALLTPHIAALFGLEAALSPLTRALIVPAPFLALSALLGAGPWVPLAAIQEHAGEVIQALDGPRGQHVISKLQGGLVLFSNQVVATTSSDATRFAEALVHPALAAAESRKRVLVFDDAAGAVTREVLRWPDVERITLLPSDPALLDLARHSQPFRALGAAALDSPRVHWQSEEPAVYVLKTHDRFPVIVANLADPSSYLASKYFTVRFFQAVRERLAPAGLFALQITSPERTPRTHASILATLRQAGFAVVPYRAPLPTLGEWGFALAAPALACSAAARERDAAPPAVTCAEAERQLAELVQEARPLPPGTSLITPATLPSLFVGRDTLDARSAEPNYLYQQALLDTYQSEEHALSE